MSADDVSGHWHLVQLKPNCLRMATHNLQRQGFKTFCPLDEHTRRKGERFETQVRPLFPGYVFVRFDPETTPWRSINYTYGVSRLVCFQPYRPARVPCELVSGLMRRCDETGRLLPPATLKPGDQVKVTAGPFADFIATVETLLPERRVWVLMDILNRPTRVALDPSDVRVA